MKLGIMFVILALLAIMPMVFANHEFAQGKLCDQTQFTAVAPNRDCRTALNNSNDTGSSLNAWQTTNTTASDFNYLMLDLNDTYNYNITNVEITSLPVGFADTIHYQTLSVDYSSDNATWYNAGVNVSNTHNYTLFNITPTIARYWRIGVLDPVGDVANGYMDWIGIYGDMLNSTPVSQFYSPDMSVNITNGSQYGGFLTAQFAVHWISTVDNITWVFLVINNQTFGMTLLNGTEMDGYWTYPLTSLDWGTHSWNSSATNLSLTNYSIDNDLIILQNTTWLLSFNATNTNGTYGNVSIWSCGTNTAGKQAPLTLYRNGSVQTTGNYILASYTTPVGFWNYSCYAASSQNYSTTQQLTIISKVLPTPTPPPGCGKSVGGHYYNCYVANDAGAILIDFLGHFGREFVILASLLALGALAIFVKEHWK